MRHLTTAILLALCLLNTFFAWSLGALSVEVEAQFERMSEGVALPGITIWALHLTPAFVTVAVVAGLSFVGAATRLLGVRPAYVTCCILFAIDLLLLWINAFGYGAPFRSIVSELS